MLFHPPSVCLEIVFLCSLCVCACVCVFCSSFGSLNQRLMVEAGYLPLGWDPLLSISYERHLSCLL